MSSRGTRTHRGQPAWLFTLLSAGLVTTHVAAHSVSNRMHRLVEKAAPAVLRRAEQMRSAQSLSLIVQLQAHMR